MTDRRIAFISALALTALALAVLAGCDGDPRATATAAPPGLNGIRYLSAAGGDDAGFARALTPRRFEFPADHGAHRDFRTEWWYFTGNVADAEANHYGFELTLFRIALRPPGPARESTLASNEIWMAHLTVTDTARQRFQAAERLSRGAGIAGVAEPAGAASTLTDNTVPIVIAVEDWQIAIAGQTITLAAAADGFGLALELTGLDRIVAQGDGGLDAKGAEPGNASYYYSAPRLAVTGEILSAGSAAVAVRGAAWMDREWSTSALAPELAGWDWFALQLDDGRDLMFYRLRATDGRTSPFSGGSIVDAAGNLTRLDADDVELSVTREWISPGTGVRYPVAWRMTLPAHALRLAVEPRLDSQELDLAVRYWEGAVTVSGDAAGQAVTGQGYLELAGY